ncbi:MAG: hypothetical protein COV52_01185 [Gammaproteobacteria bacterium CG11_big_fil_rev_8_21_14_0_20_46_22]|nr:MAG: hypothetical protein COW05_03480 [Gammaproteobacteria bacterium CG12_big_fil_rev_8_21_14_0_65_46_12]PIR11970.1 MAG: hypothetical protein COV52_01185 [Gammaproteobacteria bacterium CG11_big_fil_rev_8_21_14_0_20_46_22]
MKIKKLALAACGASLLVSGAFAASSTLGQNLVNNTPNYHWLVRLRGIAVVPDAHSSSISTIGGHVNDISSAYVPELDFSYFFTKHISTELILATTRHNLTATGTSLGKVDLGSVFLLPPTLTAQWHFLPDSKFDPYAGVGINYTLFYHVNSGPTASKIHYSNSVGPAFDIGADYKLNKRWALNVDVKKIYISTNAHVYVGSSVLRSDVDINPWVFGVGVGYFF